MDTTNNTHNNPVIPLMKESWRGICDTYLKEFCAKHGYDIEYELRHGYAWVGNDPGTICEIGDMFVHMDDIRYDIDNEVPEDKFEKWYWTSVDRYELGTKYMNYPSYCKGAPDPLSPEKEAELKRLREEVAKAHRTLEEAISEYKRDGYDVKEDCFI